MIQLETFSELKRERPWRIHYTAAGYSIVDANGVTVALNLALADAQLIITASDEKWEGPCQTMNQHGI